MKLQANELPIMKNQITRRRNPKIAPLVALVLLLLTIIPIYYPFLKYSNKNSSPSSQIITFEASIKEQDPCHNDDASRDKTGHCQNENTDRKMSDATATDDHPATGTFDADVQKITSESGEVATVEDTTTSDTNVKKTSSRTSDVATEDDTVTSNTDIKKTLSGSSEVTTGERIEPVQATERTLTQPDRDATEVELEGVEERRKCNIFSGEWVPNPEGPYYTNDTCWAIQEHQNCMKFGKPGPGYMKWKFKPDECELPIFDPFQFMELVKGKSMAFVGDSVARNHMQSLICLLSRVEEPEDVSEVPYGSQFKRYEFKNNKLAIEIFWSPYLVKTTQTDPVDASSPFNLYLDEFDEKWTTKIENFDYVIISAGHWFFRPTMFYVNGRVVGCLYCPQSDIPHLTSYFSYRRAFRTAFRAINDLQNYKGLTFLRTFAPSHFEGGYWDKGGDCVRKRPFRRNETHLKDYNLQLYNIQLDELKIAERFGRRRGLKYRLFDVTQAMLMRPDGHPSKYGHWPQNKVSLAKDCVHWCLPGPVDAWNDFFLELLKREKVDSLV